MTKHECKRGRHSYFHAALLMAMAMAWTAAAPLLSTNRSLAQEPRDRQSAGDEDPDSPFRLEDDAPRPQQPGPDAQRDQGSQNDRNGPSNRPQGRRWGGRSRTPGIYERNNARVLSAFDGAASTPARSVAAVYCGTDQVALGTVVDPSGYILTKASELRGKCDCLFHDGRRLAARIVGIDPQNDLAMLRVEADGLDAAPMSDAEPPPVGSLLVALGIDQRPRGMGIVSVVPRRIEGPRGLLGILLEQDDRGPRVQEVMPESGAASAGLMPGDVITSINGNEVKTREALIETVRQFQPGDKVHLLVARGDDVMSVTATLSNSDDLARAGRQEGPNNLAGPLSNRRSGFPAVFQHDIALRPSDCGGPVVDLDGRVVGINIARVGRVDSYAVPTTAVLSVLDDLKSGKLSPRGEFQRRLDELLVVLDGLTKREMSLADRLSTLQQTATGDSAPKPEDAEGQARQTQQELELVRVRLKQAEAEREWLESELE